MHYDNKTMETIGATKVVLDLYKEMVERYRTLYRTLHVFDDEFEINHIDEDCWLKRADCNIRKDKEPPTRFFIDVYLDYLCKMEADLVRLENIRAQKFIEHNNS